MEVGPRIRLKDINLFIKSCTVINGTLGWDIKGYHDLGDCLDLDPDNLYMNCEEVSEPDIKLYS